VQAAHVGGGLPVEIQHLFVPASHQQQGRARHPRKRLSAGQVGSPAARHHGPDGLARRSGGHQGGGCAGAGAEIAHRQGLGELLLTKPARCRAQSLRQQGNVEAGAIVPVFLGREQVKQQGAHAARVQHPGHEVVARAVAAAAAAVGEQHHPEGIRR